MGYSASEIILEIICPALGVGMANVMFSAPYRAVKEAIKRGYLGDLNPTPWAFMTGNCLGWLFYSFQTRDFFLYFANAPGLILSIWLNLCAAKLQFHDYRAKSMRHSFVSYMGTSQRRRMSIYSKKAKNKAAQATAFGKEVLFHFMFQNGKSPSPHQQLTIGIIIIWMAVLSITFFASFSNKTRETIVGVVVNCNLLFFYGAPLTVIFRVLKTKNSASIHLWTMTTNTMNGCFWSAYGIAIMDPFVLVPNAIGAAMGFVQILLVCTYPRKNRDEVDETMKEFTTQLGPIAEEDVEVGDDGDDGDGDDDEVDYDDPYYGIDQISDPSEDGSQNGSESSSSVEHPPVTSNGHVSFKEGDTMDKDETLPDTDRPQVKAKVSFKLDNEGNDIVDVETAPTRLKKNVPKQVVEADEDGDMWA